MIRFFEKVMEDKDVCEEVIRIIMEDPGFSIKEVKPQESVHNLQGRSVRRDALCERSDGSYINIELQRADPVYVDDGFTSIYVNTAIDDKTEIAELMNCFLQTKVDNPKFPKLSNRVAQFKEDEEGVREMCAIVEEYAKEYAEEYAKEYAEEYAKKRANESRREGIELGKAEGIINVLRKYNVPDDDILEEIQNQLRISEKDAQWYMDMFA